MYDGGITIFKRRFLVEGLPPGHPPSGPHLQIFDNFPKNSGLRLRKIRNPETREWKFTLEKEYLSGKYPRKNRIEQIVLSENEYESFDSLRGGETRKNRYHFDEVGLGSFTDIYLGKLWGLNISTIWSEHESSVDIVIEPQLSVLEITGDDFFAGATIADLEFADIRVYLERKKASPEMSR